MCACTYVRRRPVCAYARACGGREEKVADARGLITRERGRQYAKRKVSRSLAITKKWERIKKKTQKNTKIT